jgi:hypothetical protein
MNRDRHWENVYKTKSPEEMSWYEPHLATSLEWGRNLLLSLLSPPRLLFSCHPSPQAEDLLLLPLPLAFLVVIPEGDPLLPLPLSLSSHFCRCSSIRNCLRPVPPLKTASSQPKPLPLLLPLR